MILFITIIIALIFVILIIVWFIRYLIYNGYFIEFTDIKTDCKYRRWGCCDDNITPKLDYQGSNCRGF